MTLILTLIRPTQGIWQSVDQRLTKGGKPYDDSTPKQVLLAAANGTLLLAFTGLAEINGSPLTDWIRESLRGSNRTMEGHFRFLIERANRDVSSTRLRRHELTIIGAGMEGARPLLPNDSQKAMPFNGVAFIFSSSNRHHRAGRAVVGDFEYSCQLVDRPAYGAAGSGAAFFNMANKERLEKAALQRPNRPSDYSGLLASVNRDIATRMQKDPRAPNTVSPWARSVFLPVEGLPWIPQEHRLPMEPTSGALFIPLVLHGADMTDLMARSIEAFMLKEELSQDEMDRLGRESEIPRL